MQQHEAIAAILREYDEATAKFGKFASPHEGVAIIEEEFLELRSEVFWRKRPEIVTKEAIQIAAMALRFLTDLCPMED